MDFLRKRKIAATKKKEAAERRVCLLTNGRFMLEEMISSFNGKSNPVRSFSAPVILKATNNFDSTSGGGWDELSRVCKCIIDNLPVLVKSYRFHFFEEDMMKRITRDIAVSSQMSSHKNVLKLIGCCLELPYPVLVFEYCANGALNDRDCGLETGKTLPWNIRLKIAKETASAVSYLHTALLKRMVHRNIKPSNIFLDDHWNAKISDFSDSIFIPDGEPHVETPMSYGTIGLFDPDYSESGCINESSDVFSYGIFLLGLVTGKPPLPAYGLEDIPACPRDLVADARDKGELIEILDPRLVEEAVAEEALEMQQMQWKAFIELALICSRDKREIDRR